MTGPRPVPELTGSGIRLTQWRDDDAIAVVEMAEDSATRFFSPSMRTIRTPQDALAWLRSRVTSDRAEWAVRDPATAELLGRVNLHRFTEHPLAAEVGYAVHPRHRRRGVATASVATVLRYAVEDMGLARVSLVHAAGNLASCAVATRCGFAYEGLERGGLDNGDGILTDAHRHARLATDPPTVSGQPDTARPVMNSIPHVEIDAGGLHLRPPTAQDTADAALMLRDPDVRRWNAGPADLDLGQVRDWCARGADWSGGDHATFTVFDRDSGRLVGNVSLHRIDREQADAEIGYRVAPWARGRGVASTAVAATARWAFTALPLVRIELAHAVANPASCRVADNAGFPLEGTLRQSYVYGDGRRYDEHLHARLRTDHP